MEAHLNDSDNLTGKLKEDIGLKEEELEFLRQEVYDLKKQQERLPFLEAQVRQFSFGRDFMGNE